MDESQTNQITPELPILEITQLPICPDQPDCQTSSLKVDSESVPSKDPIKRSVFLLRHEKRGGSASFKSPLTAEGLDNASNIVCPRLDRLGIDVIYCSPFLRTLQTIKPFCEKSGMKVNLEWSLVESIPFENNIDDEFKAIINSEYSSFAPYERPDSRNIMSFDLLKHRIKAFIETLDRSKNILLVTHLPVINAILSYKGFESIEMFTHHRPGSLLSMSKGYV